MGLTAPGFPGNQGGIMFTKKRRMEAVVAQNKRLSCIIRNALGLQEGDSPCRECFSSVYVDGKFRSCRNLEYHKFSETGSLIKRILDGLEAMVKERDGLLAKLDKRMRAWEDVGNDNGTLAEENHNLNKKLKLLKSFIEGIKCHGNPGGASVKAGDASRYLYEAMSAVVNDESTEMYGFDEGMKQASKKFEDVFCKVVTNGDIWESRNRTIDDLEDKVQTLRERVAIEKRKIREKDNLIEDLHYNINEKDYQNKVLIKQIIALGRRPDIS